MLSTMSKSSDLYPRFLTDRIASGLTKSPVVTIVGPRQSGKTTLARGLVGVGGYRTLDDPQTLQEVAADPLSFLRGLPHPAVIDEVQHSPSLLRAIKLVVDEDRRPGRFLITGSADVLAVPQISESLAGRTRFHTLHPLAQVEIRGAAPHILDALWSGSGRFGNESPPLSGRDLIDLVTRGGFPQAVREDDPRERRAWLGDYLTAIVQRDLRDLGAIRQATAVPRLLAIVAAQSPGDLNTSALSTQIGLNRATIDRYLSLLEQTFMLRRVPAWHANIRTQQIRSPKMLIIDPALQSHLVDAGAQQLSDDPTRLGRLTENFVGTELMRLASWTDGGYRLYHWRSSNSEVDFVLERGEQIMGIEVKISSAVGADAFRGLRALQSAEPNRFRGGIILYSGARRASFGNAMTAIPLSALWATPTG
jgi:uncharacterized protein